MTPVYSTLDQGYDFFVSDKWKRNYHFKILSFHVPSGLLSNAIEVVKEKDREPYIFNVLSDIDEEKSESEILLKHKIRDGINKRFLKYENGKFEMRDEGRLSGRIEWTDELNDSYFDLFLIVDGKRVTIENFVHMLNPYFGFNFDFEIRDPSD